MDRKVIRLIPAVALAVLFLCSQAMAYQVSIMASASKTDLNKGEPFTYTLKIIEEGSPDRQTQLIPPDLTGFNVSSTSTQSSIQVARDKERKVTETAYRLSSDIPGEHTIPPAKLVLIDPKSGERQEMPSNEVKVRVSEEKQGLIGGIKGEIRDIKEPKTLIDRIKLYFYSLVALVVLAFLILVGFSMYLAGRKKKAKKAAAPLAPAGPGPREAALREIEAAKDSASDTRVYYTRVADAVRRYLAAVYGINAMEATTAELVERAGRTSIPAASVGEIGAFFTEADMVKFAKYMPGEDEKDSFRQKAASLVKGL